MSSYRLTRIDELHLAEFPYLRPDDDCYYHGEYTVRQGYDFSTTNDLVINLKKGLEYKNGPAWKYKAQAIRTCADAFLGGVGSEWLSTVTLVPIPPSKAKSDPQYDDRILQILRALEASASVRCDVRELIIQRRSYDPSHSSSDRISPADLHQLYHLAPDLLEPQPVRVALVDDVLTTGAHFRAGKDLLLKQWPDAHVTGLFVARAVWLEDDDWTGPF